MGEDITIKKILAFTIIFLLIGISIVSSTGKKVDKYIDNTSLPVAVHNREELLACDHEAYLISSDAYHDNVLYEFILNNPGNLTKKCSGSGPNLVSSGAWTHDQRLLVVEYTNGALYEIDTETCEIITIGGGGTDLNGLTYDLTDHTLYGCSSSDLYKIDPEGRYIIIIDYKDDERNIEDVSAIAQRLGEWWNSDEPFIIFAPYGGMRVRVEKVKEG